MGDFLMFRRMTTPIIMQILFWLGVVAIVIAGLVTLAGGSGTGRFGGLLIIFLGTVGIRVYAEFFIVIFRMNETLSEIRRELRRDAE